ncbi:hypothetical protein B0T20DRAFT_230084 [Sordaria brevicollis]|uniref:N-acetyltransferase domain-containing protein n=1 Tax=Sordaria brevicollis TaxID=83679 RepID=A0AAE0UB80_SORBR|nr:hypothetical protein B0T20DRAFT_230084 [Sordaria brevicollis]
MPPPTTDPSTIQILPGYRPGILGRTLEMHMDYYGPLAGWGHYFESYMASSLGPFLKRLDDAVDPFSKPPTTPEEKAAAAAKCEVIESSKGRNQVWTAIQTEPDTGKQRIVGTAYIDGDFYRLGEHKEEGGEEVCRLRFVIVDESVRGMGIGGKLFDAAMAFVGEKGYRECRLSTSKALKAAVKIYERGGFVLVQDKIEEYIREDNGKKEFWNMRDYVWRRDGNVGANGGAGAARADDDKPGGEVD